jgi:UDP-N-acetyl-D-mannosaminuronic acid dehydrogenase
VFEPSGARLPVSETPQVVVVGCGAIGLPLATAFAARGCDVLGVDTDPARLAALRAGCVGDVDERLDDAFASAVAAGRLAFAASLAASDRPRAFILVVPTPVGTDGAPVLENVDAGANAIVAAARDGDLLLVRATVPVGTTRRLARIAAAQGRELRVAACPDRSVAGRCFVEQFSVPHIVGGMDGDATRAAVALFARLGPTVAVSSPEVAEAAKLFANVQRDVTFALANQLALASEQLALDFGEIVHAASEGYARFSLARPGPVNGPCLTKDTALLAHSLGRESIGVARAARALNESLLDHVADAVARHLGARARPVVTVLGLAFKGNPPTADRRGSFGVALADRLRADLAHATLRLGEPTSDDPAERDLDHAVAGADVVVIANDHARIKALDPPTLAMSLRGGALIYDACCALAPAKALPNGVILRRIGDGRHFPAAIASKRAR